jgi:hypothetical protein
MKNFKFTITVATQDKHAYRYMAISFKSSSDALLNAMKVLQGDVPRLLKVEAVR